MKKVLVSAFALAMLSSSAFADTSKLSAFQGVETAAVSAAELDQVSGEGVLADLLGGLLNGLLGNVLGDVLGVVTTLGLLEGLTVDSNTNVNTGVLVGGLTGIQSIGLSISVQ